ncbi:hypothetical protein [Pontibacter litorisediminis]|uniref:hypothetical protein n=1 Tax=Pontibacter litorisediminis TaxID=1846260 RepID=UPI0023EB57D6|nr:hypothetical protein [Pontibacter litorisediminis]
MKQKAIEEVLGLEMRPAEANKMFRNVFVYLLQHDTRCLLQALDYRDTLGNTGRPVAQYKIFKFILQSLLRHNPRQLVALCPM